MSLTIRRILTVLFLMGLAVPNGWAEGMPPAAGGHAGFAARFDNFAAYDPPRALLPAVDIVGIDGDVRRLDDLKGKWRLVNFWGLWCPACLEEVPSLVALQQSRASDRFEVLLVFVDPPMEGEDVPAGMRKRVAQAGLPETLYFYYAKDMGFWEKLGIEGIPVSMIVDPQGLVRYKLMGNVDWRDKESLAFVDDFLKN